MKKIYKTPLATAVSVAVISSLAATAYAESNPFAMNELSQGYMQLAEASDMSMHKPKEEKPAAEAKSGEMKCGGMMNGDKMKKGMESACGAMMKGKEGACGMMSMGGDKAKEPAKDATKKSDMKMPEGKCGDKCGENMKQCETVKTKEGACGAKMKGCGEGMQGCTEMMKDGNAATTKKPPVPAAK